MSIDFDVNKALEQLGHIVQTQGPKAVEIASSVVQVNAVETLVGGVMWAGMSLIPLWAMRFCWKQTKQPADWDERWSFDPPWQAYAGAVCAFIAFCVMLIKGIDWVTDVWTWIALFNPKLALAHEVYEKIRG